MPTAADAGRMLHPGDEVAGSPAGPRLDAGAGGRSPILPPGMVDRPSKRQVRGNPEQGEPDAAKPLSENGLGR
jgi:hypothetical protein